MAAAADYSYLESSSSTSNLPLSSYNNSNKSNSAEVYQTVGLRSMGVLVTGPWPMSQPIYDRPSVSVPLQSSCTRRSLRESKDYSNCQHNQQYNNPHQLINQHHHHHHHHHHHSGGDNSMRTLRPFSVPPSNGSLTYNNDANHMELMPLDSNHIAHSAVPSRATLTDLHPTSPPTCVPWLRKMKVIKKIQRKIGIG